MATIILGPDESFEHYHAMGSHTKLLKGHAELHFEGKTIRLEEEVPIFVPAQCPHVILNIGTGKAYIQCEHVKTVRQLPVEPGSAS
jgi:quercetin dioxygenase-like cupin family protein